MPALTVILLIYTVLMLGLHLTSWKLLEKWHAAEDSWVRRRLPVMRLLRIEAGYWLLALAVWPWWSFVTKVVVAVFAGIHIALWISTEWKRIHDGTLPGQGALTRKSVLVVTTFDLVEALALITLGYSALSLLLHA